MLYRQLGKSSLQVSEISLGCMSLEAEKNKVSAMLYKAIDLGINFFDTADLYLKGVNEEMIGHALKGKRKDILLASKAGNQWRSDGSGWDWNPRKKYILQAAEKSLRRLQTDYLDLYQLHGGTINDPIDETIEAFELLQQQGKIRHYGISSIRPNVIREYVKRSHIVSVMMQYSLLDRRPEEECLPLLQQNKIGVLARGSIAQGLLSGKPAKEYLGYSAEDVTKMANAVQSFSGAERSASQTAIQYTLQHPAVTSAVVGARTIEQLTDAAATQDNPSFSASEKEIVTNTLPPNTYADHR